MIVQSKEKKKGKQRTESNWRDGKEDETVTSVAEQSVTFGARDCARPAKRELGRGGKAKENRAVSMLSS